MRNALTSSLLAGIVLFAAGGCSGGSSDSTAAVRIRCINGEAFCIISCDLGCSQAGCSATEVAENQRLSFKFSQPVNRATVNSASFSIRTASGVSPDGFFEFSESDTVVKFVPRVSTTGGTSTFGFLRNESYVISLAGGATGAFGIRGLDGAGLKQELVCTVVASRGIADEDQLAPYATLISPLGGTAPRNPTIVLRFSELIDTTALLGPLSVASPIRVLLRGTRADGSCDRDAEGTALEGLVQLSSEVVGPREVTVVTYQPPVQLPGQSCVTVYVTAELRDLSGRSATPGQFEFTTIAGSPTAIGITESFVNGARQDPLVSSGVWSNGARPGLLGGDGRHGPFNAAFGTPLGGNVFEWKTDTATTPPTGVTIPATNTLNGQQYVVLDGKFFFTDMTLPQGTTLRFTGNVAPQIYVRGQVDVRGTIQVNGVDLPFGIPTGGLAASQRVSTFNARNTTTNPRNGQPGTAGGPGGGRGGKGGDKGTLATAVPQPPPPLACNGSDGSPLQFPLGHTAYSAGPVPNFGGGVGSPIWPTAGTQAAVASLTPLLANAYRGHFARGGGGGSFQLNGQLPTGLTNPPAPNPALGFLVSPPLPAGTTFTNVYPTPPDPGYSSLTHYLVGGSGGGGGGSHPFGLIGIGPNLDFFMAGSGGSGGGGTLAIRAGGDLVVSGSGLLESKGGLGVLICGDDPSTLVQEALSQATSFGVSSPGGGGSGGSILLQSGRNLLVQGRIDTSGGPGSRIGSITPTNMGVTGQGGAGAPGFYRLEAGGVVNFAGTGISVPAFVAGSNDGSLADRDSTTGDLTTWYATNVIFPPTWLRYELDVDQDGDGTIDITYTDSDPALRANSPANAVMIRFQGTTLNQSGTAPLPGAPIKPWRDGIGSAGGPGLALDSVTGFRFMLTWNRDVYPNAVVRQLRVFAQS